MKKKRIPIGTSNYREVRMNDFYTVDTRCAQKRKSHDTGFPRTGDKGNFDYTSPSFWKDVKYVDDV